MSLTNEERNTLVQMELRKAHEAYRDIEVLTQAGRWNGAANRLYYSVFHAVNALFINDGLQAGRHKTSHSLFSLHYIKTGVLPVEFGRLLTICKLSERRATTTYILNNSFTSTSRHLATSIRFSKLGCALLVHHLDTVAWSTPICSANHLLVRFFSASTTFSRFKYNFF